MWWLRRQACQLVTICSARALLQLRNRLVALSELQSAVKLHEARTRSLSVQVEEAHAALSKERESNEAIRRQVRVCNMRYKRLCFMVDKTAAPQTAQQSAQSSTQLATIQHELSEALALVKVYVYPGALFELQVSSPPPAQPPAPPGTRCSD